MLFDLRSELRERGFADGGQVLALVGSVERGCGKSERQREAVLSGSGNSGKNAMELNKIGIIGFQKP